VVLEALAEGLPVIGFDGGMLKELQLKAVAIAVPKFDVENLAQAIIDFAEGKLHFKDDCQEAAMQYSHQNILPKFSHLLNVNR
jgi:glycosyltransferase involved in cell wall biosynthesis